MCNTSKKQIIKGKVISNEETCHGHFVMEVEAPGLGQNSLPGQFVNVKPAENTFDPLLRIPLGIHSIEERGIKLLYKVVGNATRILSKKTKGSDIDLLGPLGNGFDLGPAMEKDMKSLIIAGGHGIAPLYALCEELVKRNIPVDFFTGVKSKEHLTCTEALEDLGIKTYVSSMDGSVGFKGNITEVFKKEITMLKRDKKKGFIFSCGPRQMLKEVASIARKEKIEAQVSLDAYMACGIGVCLGCAVKTVEGFKLVCKDGPVFNAEEIVWDEI